MTQAGKFSRFGKNKGDGADTSSAIANVNPRGVAMIGLRKGRGECGGVFLPTSGADKGKRRACGAFYKLAELCRACQLLSVELKNDGAETARGITIGSSEADVRAKYGEPDENNDRSLVYVNGDKRLEIGITDGAVSSIVLKCK